MSDAMNSWTLLAVPFLIAAYIFGVNWATRPDKETAELIKGPARSTESNDA